MSFLAGFDLLAYLAGRFRWIIWVDCDHKNSWKEPKVSTFPPQNLLTFVRTLKNIGWSLLMRNEQREKRPVNHRRKLFSLSSRKKRALYPQRGSSHIVYTFYWLYSRWKNSLPLWIAVLETGGNLRSLSGRLLAYKMEAQFSNVAHVEMAKRKMFVSTEAQSKN